MSCTWGDTNITEFTLGGGGGVAGSICLLPICPMGSPDSEALLAGLMSLRGSSPGHVVAVPLMLALLQLPYPAKKCLAAQRTSALLCYLTFVSVSLASRLDCKGWRHRLRHSQLSEVRPRNDM